MSANETPLAFTQSTDGITAAANPGQLFDGSAASKVAATTYSVPFLAKTMDRIAIQVSSIAAGGAAPNGAITIEGSNDRGSGQGQGATPDATLTNWAPISFFDETLGQQATGRNIAATGVSYHLTVQQHGPRWLRVKWTHVGGSAALAIFGQAKSIAH